MEQFIVPSLQLGGTVFTVVAFLSYLSKLLKIQEERDTQTNLALIQQAKSNITLARALEKLTGIVGKNTTAVKENKPVVEENTGAVSKNTEEVAKNTNGNGK